MKRPRRRARSRCATAAGFGLLELVVLIGILVLLGSFLLPSLCRSRETANRVKCASNLRQIGQAMLLYANDNGGHYPRGIYASAADPRPVWGTGPDGKNPFAGNVQPNDVTAAMFLLLRTQDITSEVFVCPSSNNEKDVYGGGNNAPADRSNFTDIKLNLSYSLHNAYPKNGVVPADDDKWWTSGMSNAEFAITADINPGIKPSSYDDVLKPTTTSAAKEMKLANSNNHDKDGQNILYADGHVAWESNPFVGVERDNIYTTRDSRVIASPADRDDSILLPTDD